MSTADNEHGVLVTGATGFLGSHLVLRLLKDTSRHIHCLVREGRDDARARLLGALRTACHVSDLPVALVDGAEHRLHVVAGDISQPGLAVTAQAVAALQAAGISQVWHLASSLHYDEASRAAIYQSNVEGTIALLKLCGELQVQAFHHVSTAYVAGKRTGVIAETLPEGIDDGSAFHNPYEQSKAHAEVDVATRCRAAGIRYRIFRPSVVIGHARTFRSNSDTGLYGMLRRLYLFKARTDRRMPGYLGNKRVLLYGDGAVPSNLIPIDAFIDQVWDLAAAPEAADGIFHIVNPSPPRSGTVANIMGFCLELGSLEMSTDERQFDLIDNNFRKSYEFYQGYMQTPKVFDNAQVGRLLGARRTAAPLVGSGELEKYILAYLDSLSGVEEAASVFSRFSRSLVSEKLAQSADGMTIPYFVTGSANKPPLVLVNAFGSDLESWGPTVNFFRERFRILTWNLRGLPDASRFSDAVDVSIAAHAEDLHAILRAEGIERAVVVGWCAGPKISLEFYRRHPDMVRALVLVTGKYDTDQNPDSQASPYSKLFAELNQRIKECPLVAKLVVEAILRGKAQNREGGAAGTILSVGPSLEYAGYMVAPFQSPENLVMYSKMSRSYGTHDIYDMLLQIEVPTLVLAAENDLVAHPESSRRVAAQIKNSELVVLPQASHWCLVDSAGTFVHAVSRFLKSHQLG